MIENRGSKLETTDHSTREMLKQLEDVVRRVGYERVTSIEELGLTPEEKGKMGNISRRMNGVQFYRVQRGDGVIVKALIKPNTSANNYVADLFSPAFFEGHMSNNDFTLSDLENNLNVAKE